MGRQHPGDLLVVKRLEVACRSQVQPAAVASGEGRVGHFADDCLHEAELAALGRARIGGHHQQLPTNELAQQRLDDGALLAHDCRQRFQCEGLPEDRCTLRQGALLRRQRIEASADQCLKGLRHRQLRQVADGLERHTISLEVTVGKEHADGLHRIQRDPLGAGQDPIRGNLRQTVDQAAEQASHGREG